MSRCAGAGREHSQAGSPRCPMEIFHIMDVILCSEMGLGRGAGILFFCEFKLYHEFMFLHFGEKNWILYS